MKKQSHQLWQKNKSKEKVFIDEESKTKEEQVLDAAIEAAITRATSTARERTNLLDHIAEITIEELDIATPSTSIVKKTLTKTPITISKTSSKQNKAPSRSAAAMQALKELGLKKIKSILLAVEQATRTRQTSPSQEKRKSTAAPLNLPRKTLRNEV